MKHALEIAFYLGLSSMAGFNLYAYLILSMAPSLGVH